LPDSRGKVRLDSLTYNRGGRRALVAAAGGLYLLAGLIASGAPVRTSFEQGLGFSNRQWQQSPLLASAAALPSGTLIYTNAPEPLELYTRLPVLALPKKYESANQQANPEYAAQMEQVRQAVSTRPAVIAYFTSVQRPSLPTLDELQGELAQAVSQPFADGVILALPAP
jgi:hypothetical protein